MRVGEIVEPQNNSMFGRVLDSAIWNRKAEKISAIDLDVLYAQLRIHASMDIAQRACDFVYIKLATALVNGEISYLGIKQKRWRDKLITQSFFEECLNSISSARADCVRFALEMGWSIEEAVVVTRKELKEYTAEMTELAFEVFKRQPISFIRSTLFWEDVAGQHRSLISMRQMVEQVFKTDWPNMLSQYDPELSSFPEYASKDQVLKQVMPATSLNTPSDSL